MPACAPAISAADKALFVPPLPLGLPLPVPDPLGLPRPRDFFGVGVLVATESSTITSASLLLSSRLNIPCCVLSLPTDSCKENNEPY